MNTIRPLRTIFAVPPIDNVNTSSQAFAIMMFDVIAMTPGDRIVFTPVYEFEVVIVCKRSPADLNPAMNIFSINGSETLSLSQCLATLVEMIQGYAQMELNKDNGDH